jgi:hypothetical protein
MGRPPTRQLTMQFVLRTFERLRMIASRYDAEWLTKELAPYSHQISFPAQFAADMADCMRAMKLPLDKPPNNEKCAQCGGKISCDHNGAIYCSRECRQCAYRVRKAMAKGRNSPIPKRKRTKPTAREAAIAEVKEMFDRQKEALAFANTMYALHLKAHPGEMKGSAEPQSDTSSSAESERNVS